MDPVLIGVVATVATLFIERLFSWAKKVKRSSCCGKGVVVEMDEMDTSLDKPDQ